MSSSLSLILIIYLFSSILISYHPPISSCIVSIQLPAALAALRNEKNILLACSPSEPLRVILEIVRSFYKEEVQFALFSYFFHHVSFTSQLTITVDFPPPPSH